jgi:hypothetical protein
VPAEGAAIISRGISCAFGERVAFYPLAGHDVGVIHLTSH